MDPLNPDLYRQYLGPLLLAGGGMLQYLRALKGFSDKAAVPLGTGVAVAAYMLTSNWRTVAPDPQLFVITALLGCASSIGTLFGGTFLVSKVANNASENAKANNPLVPATNSK